MNLFWKKGKKLAHGINVATEIFRGNNASYVGCTSAYILNQCIA